MKLELRRAGERGNLSETTNRQFYLVRNPDGPLTRECFQLASAAVPDPKDGEVLLKARYVSIDAANRAWMQGATYRDALAPRSSGRRLVVATTGPA